MARVPRFLLRCLFVSAAVSLASAGCSNSRSGDDPESGRTSQTPVIRQAAFVDRDENGVDEGDVIVLQLSRPVVVHSGSLSGFELDASSDDLGDGAVLLQSQPGSDRVEIVLGEDSRLTPDASEINLAASGNGVVQITSADAEATRAARAARDVVIADLTRSAPVLISARIVDADADGELRAGDRVVATFNKPVVVPPGATVAENFVTVAPGDSLGTSPALEAATNGRVQRSVAIVLGDNPVLSDPGPAAGLGVAASPTITDGLPATPNALSPGVAVEFDDRGATFFGDGRAADAALGTSDPTAGARPAQTLRDPAGADQFEGTLEIGGESVTANLLFVADRGNHRVIIFDRMPAGSFPAAAWVLGAPDLTSLPDSDPVTSESRPATSSTLENPTDVAFDGDTNRLFVSDTGHNRLLVWDDLFTLDDDGDLAMESGRPATFAWGQGSLAAGAANRGLGQPTASTLSAPAGIEARDGRLLVADSGNHRVLVFGSLPSSAATAPSAVLGQADFVSGDVNRGGTVAAESLSSPADVTSSSDFSSGGSLVPGVLVADTGNNRVVFYPGQTPATGTAAAAVLGQASLTTGDPALAATRLRSPRSVTAEPGSSLVYVADTGNNRVMAYSVAAGFTTGAAGAPIGQTSPTAGNPNQGGAPAAGTLSAPAAVSMARSSLLPSTLLVSDAGNHRLLLYDGSAPPAADRPATLVIGQPSFASGSAGGGRYQQPFDLLLVRGRLVVADTANHRVLIYNSPPTAGDPDPDLVLGQADLFGTSPNRGGDPSAATLNLPTALASDGTRLAVSDTGNHRVLIWSAFPVANGAPADVVLGQTSATEASPNMGGAPTAASFRFPEGLAIAGNELIVADRDNNRVLVFSSLSSLSTGAAARNVLGQRRFDEVEPNRDGPPAADTLDGPRDVLFGAGNLYVADTGNHRVLVWDGVPQRSGQQATGLHGQATFTRVFSTPPSPESLSSPAGLAMDPGGTILAVSDTGNRRIVFFDAVEGSDPNRRFAGGVLGTRSLFPGGGEAPALGAIDAPRGIFWNGFELYAADAGSSRVVVFR